MDKKSDSQVQEPNSISKKEELSSVNWIEKFDRMDIFYLFSFLLSVYFFNAFMMALSVFAFRIVNTDSNLVPFVSVTYGMMLFMYLLNFYRFYTYLTSSLISERLDLVRSTLVSLVFILILNIIAEVIISRIPF